MGKLEQRLALLRGVLAKATKACPKLLPLPEPPCEDWCDCQGTGEVAMFPLFRQACQWCRGQKRIRKHILVLDDGTGQPYVPTDEDYDPCTRCNGLAWQVRAGGMADGLSGLTRGEAEKVIDELGTYIYGEWSAGNVWSVRQLEPMPDADTIDLKALELVCEVKGLDDEGELRPEIAERLKESLNTPREELLTPDEMRQKLEAEP